MLRFISGLMCLIFIFWLMLAAGVSAFASRQPRTDRGMAHYGFEVCELPCWAGVRLMQTDKNVVESLLESNVPALDSMGRYTTGSIYFKMGKPTSTLLYSRGDFLAIHLEFSELALFYLVDQMGSPECATVMPGTGLILYWLMDDLTVSTFLRDDTARVLTNEAATTPYLNIEIESGCDAAIPWRGFLPMWFYERLAAESKS